MKRIHLPDTDTAFTDLRGTELFAAPLVECDRDDCGYQHHWLIPESELADVIAGATQDTLRRLGLSGRAVS